MYCSVCERIQIIITINRCMQMIARQSLFVRPRTHDEAAFDSIRSRRRSLFSGRRSDESGVFALVLVRIDPLLHLNSLRRHVRLHFEVVLRRLRQSLSTGSRSAPFGRTWIYGNLISMGIRYLWEFGIYAV